MKKWRSNFLSHHLTDSMIFLCCRFWVKGKFKTHRRRAARITCSDVLQATHASIQASFTSSSYRSSGAHRGVAVCGGEDFISVALQPQPVTPHPHTIAGALCPPLSASSELFNQYNQGNRKRAATLFALATPTLPPRPHQVSARALFLTHSPKQVLQYRAIEVALNGTHSTQREYNLTTG